MLDINKMIKKRFNRTFCILIVICISLGTSLLFVQGKRQNGIIRKSAMELRRLIHEKQSQGVDVSKALELDRQSRESMRKGKPQECMRLLKRAMALLQRSQEEPSKDEVSPIMQKSVRSEYKDSPFGFHPASVVPPQDYGANDPFAFALDLGAKFDRSSSGLWILIQPDDFSQPDGLSKDYDWRRLDRLIVGTPNPINTVVNIYIESTQTALSYNEMIVRINRVGGDIWEKRKSRLIKGSVLPKDEKAYLAFVLNMVERYDGDENFGSSPIPQKVKQAIRNNPIKYWQVGNEPSTRRKDYAKLLQITYKAVKEADLNAKVLIGGVPGFPPVSRYLRQFDKSYLLILDELAEFDEQYFDIFDFHWYGNVTGDYKGVKEVYTYITQKLQERDLIPSQGFWITEMGTYSGDPDPLPFGERWDPSFSSERQHASDLLKRHIYSLSIGIKKIFGCGIKEGFKYDEGYFDFTGLIYDGKYEHDRGKGVKKLAYYTYKKMTDILEGSDWNNIETIQESDGIYIYKFTKNDKPIWVAWNDNLKKKQISINMHADGVKITHAIPKYVSGKYVTNYAAAFKTEIKKVRDSKLIITLEDFPIFIDER